VVVDTSLDDQEGAPGVVCPGGSTVTVPGRSVLLLRVVA
jgi:glycogen operon protein